MKEQKCYQDPELTLGDLAKILEVHPVILSQVINSREQKSFYDYVNTYRVETFKELLLRPDSRQYTMLSLAFECGFNSKTSFNRNFKKITQMSPSAYAKGLDVQLKAEG
ncbi:helix-turn-helix domain-containing protein [Sphingobacterium thalpophilum]|uniref:helix-turn-helix domain-containing protein n=1 Tax=Sphingobacterium thalpophilum TaxID=259 RepID=UPI0024A787A3|nr:helix-turn-helix domain-containing protein [Sphingobacterium thalpophilum]